LGPAAAQQVRAKIVIETSELVISPAADGVLAGRGVLVVPDMVGASAPLLAASAEWSSQVQKPPAPEALQREVEKGMLRAYEQVLDRSRREGLSLRTAAYCSAIEKVARSERLRVA
jgi:glutamate dehydrogenase (NAD(P)+)